MPGPDLVEKEKSFDRQTQGQRMFFFAGAFQRFFQTRQQSAELLARGHAKPEEILVVIAEGEKSEQFTAAHGIQRIGVQIKYVTFISR